MPGARVRAYAKLNLTLEVLARRPDGFHDLRTLFQTVSLADVLTIEVERSRNTRVIVESDTDIPGENLVTRAIHSVMELAGSRASVRCSLTKRIPMGAGLGGGSSDAAAILRSLPGLLGRKVDVERVREAASALGSDVPFFLMGGTALGLGRGTELYPLSDLPRIPVLIVAPGVHVSTAEAYSSLGRTPEYRSGSNVTARVAGLMAAGSQWMRQCTNDFEQVVLAQHSEIATVRRRLAATKAQLSMMTGSGSAVFGLYGDAAGRDAAALKFPGMRVFRATSLPRRMLR
ncbi:MAG TPA: 4-(cytidine 5'-diphospho)-2-C-methyl-D-erythritol kinase [Bryobacteraceae bacterium]|nr:4-(cytidine 5'-diphospho)-2-C-methyl-D-erythritol kinase [Bryobacteraceae bacterium]